jgi:hypothetical protein
MKSLSEDKLLPGRDLIHGPPEYEAGAPYSLFTDKYGGSSTGEKCGRDVKTTAHLNLVLMLRI